MHVRSDDYFFFSDEIPVNTYSKLFQFIFQKKLSGHPNIIQFITAASIGKDQSDHGQSEYLILTEFCPGKETVKSELYILS